MLRNGIEVILEEIKSRNNLGHAWYSDMPYKRIDDEYITFAYIRPLLSAGRNYRVTEIDNGPCPMMEVQGNFRLVLGGDCFDIEKALAVLISQLKKHKTVIQSIVSSPYDVFKLETGQDLSVEKSLLAIDFQYGEIVTTHCAEKNICFDVDCC